MAHGNWLDTEAREEENENNSKTAVPSSWLLVDDNN